MWQLSQLDQFCQRLPNQISDHTDVNYCSQRLNDINCVNHIRLRYYGVHESDSDFNIANLERNVLHINLATH